MQAGQSAPTTDAKQTGSALPDEQTLDQWRRRIRETTLGHYHLCMGLAIEGQSGFQAAEAHYRAALSNDPGCAAAFLKLQSLLERQGRKGEARAIVVQAAAVNPAYLADAELELARISLEMSDIRSCEAYLASYRTRAEAVPLEAALLFQQIGELHSAHGRIEEAKRYGDLALDLAPALIGHSLALARRFIEEMRIDEAAAALATYLEQHPYDATAWRLAAIPAQMQDRLDDAISMAKQSQHLSPSPAAQIQLGFSLLAAGRLDEAEVALRDAANTSGHQPWVYAILIWCLIAMNRLDEAAAMHRHHLGGNTATSRDLSNLAVLHLRAGRQDEAVRILDRICDIGIEPWHRIWIDLNRCLIQLETGRTVEAEAAMRSAWSVSPQITRFYIRCHPWAADRLMAMERRLAG